MVKSELVLSAIEWRSR